MTIASLDVCSVSLRIRNTKNREKRVRMNELHFASVTLVLCICIIPSIAVQELKLVHVLFAHKLYAPIEDDTLYEEKKTSIPETLSYEYFISTAKDMPKITYLNMYNFGVHLRETYDKLLGDIFKSDIMKMRTTEFPLSMLTAQLVNAGLWPPSKSQMWIEGLNWQPIPIDYLELKEDILLLGSLCPNFVSQMSQVLQMNETQTTISQYQYLFDYLSHYTNRNISTPSDVAGLYATLNTIVDRDEFLPNWAIDVFPFGMMYNVTLMEYDLLSATLLQRQLNGGIFLEEIIGNSLKYKIGEITKERKMMLYSGDERNIVGVLKNLDIWSPHIPKEASALIFELYLDNDTNTYGMKINYYTDDTTIPLSLPNCTEICPLQTFINTAIASIPEETESLCGWSVENIVDSGSISHHSKNLLLILTLLYFAAFHV